MTHARTVLGDIEPAELGATNYHEHLFQISPLLPGDELDDELLSGEEAATLPASGFSTMVDATPIGLGRRPEALARISAATGLRIVATTGLHRQAHYPGVDWLLDASREQLTARMVRDIVHGMPTHDEATTGTATSRHGDRPVRAGMIKAGIGYWSMTRFERTALAAVGAAHQATDAPVMVHLEHGSAAHEVLDFLEEHGVWPDAVVLAHIDRNPDPGLHSDLAQRGAYLGYDGPARTRQWPDSTLIDCLVNTAQRGGSERILLGGDVARSSRYLAYGGMPGLRYLGEQFIPRLSHAAGSALITAVLCTNPQRLLARFVPEPYEKIS